MREVVGSSPVISKDKQLFDTNHYRHTNNCECFNYYTPYSLTFIRIVPKQTQTHGHYN